MLLGSHGLVESPITAQLQEDRRLLADFGVDVISTKSLYDRSKIASSKRLKPYRLGRRGMANELAEMILGYNGDVTKSEAFERVVFTDKNMLGTKLGNVRSGKLFHRLPQNIRAVPNCFDNPWHSICMCIAPYDVVYEDALFRLRSQNKINSFDTYKAKLLEMDRGWIDVIEDIVDHLPNISLKIWQAKDTLMLLPELERILLGCSPGVLGERLKEQLTQSAPKYEAGVVWSPQDRRRLRDVYHADLDAICTAYADCLVS